MSFPVDSTYVPHPDAPDGMTPGGVLALHRDGHQLVLTRVAGDISCSPALYWVASVTNAFVPWVYQPGVLAVAAAPPAAAVQAVAESYKGSLHHLFCLLCDCFYIDTQDQYWAGVQPFCYSVKVEALERMALRVQSRLSGMTFSSYGDWMQKLRSSYQVGDATSAEFRLQAADLYEHCMRSEVHNFYGAARSLLSDTCIYTEQTYKALANSKGRLHMVAIFVVRAGPTYTPSMAWSQARQRLRPLMAFLRKVDCYNFPESSIPDDDLNSARTILGYLLDFDVPYFLQEFDQRPFSHDSVDSYALSLPMMLAKLQWHLGPTEVKKGLIKRHFEQVISPYANVRAFCHFNKALGLESPGSVRMCEVVRSLASALNVSLAEDSTQDLAKLNSALTDYTSMMSAPAFQIDIQARLESVINRVRVVSMTAKGQGSSGQLIGVDMDLAVTSSYPSSVAGDLALLLTESDTVIQLERFVTLSQQIDDPMRYVKLLMDATLFDPTTVLSAKDSLWRQIVFGGKRPATSYHPGLSALYQACTDSNIMRYLLVTSQFGNGWLSVPFTDREREVFNRLVLYSDQVDPHFLGFIRTGRWDKICFYNDFVRVLQSAEAGITSSRRYFEAENVHVELAIESAMERHLPFFFRALTLNPDGASSYCTIKREVMRVLALAAQVRCARTRVSARRQVAAIMQTALREGGELFARCAKDSSPRVELIPDLQLLNDTHLNSALKTLEEDIRRQLR